METRPLPQKQSNQTPALSKKTSRLHELVQKTNFALLRSAKLPAWHKTTLTTFDASQPAAIVFKLSVAAAVALDLWNCITEEHLPPNNMFCFLLKSFVLKTNEQFSKRMICFQSESLGMVRVGN